MVSYTVRCVGVKHDEAFDTGAFLNQYISHDELHNPSTNTGEPHNPATAIDHVETYDAVQQPRRIGWHNSLTVANSITQLVTHDRRRWQLS